VTIELRAIELFGFHGVLEHERREGQRFLVDVELDYENEAAAAKFDETVKRGRIRQKELESIQQETQSQQSEPPKP